MKVVERSCTIYRPRWPDDGPNIRIPKTWRADIWSAVFIATPLFHRSPFTQDTRRCNQTWYLTLTRLAASVSLSLISESECDWFRQPTLIPNFWLTRRFIQSHFGIDDSSITKQIVVILSPSPVFQRHFEIVSLKADGQTKRPIRDHMEEGERCFPLTLDGEQVWAPVISQSGRTPWTRLKTFSGDCFFIEWFF